MAEAFFKGLTKCLAWLPVGQSCVMAGDRIGDGTARRSEPIDRMDRSRS
jgi:hypothetical protein